MIRHLGREVARTRLQDVDARVPVGQRDELPGIHSQGVAHQRDRVRERDVHVPVRVRGRCHVTGARTAELVKLTENA